MNYVALAVSFILSGNPATEMSEYWDTGCLNRDSIPQCTSEQLPESIEMKKFSKHQKRIGICRLDLLDRCKHVGATK